MAYRSYEERVDEYTHMTLGQLIKEAARAAVEDHEYRHSGQHFSQLDYIVDAVDKKYGAALQKLLESERHEDTRAEWLAQGGNPDGVA